MNDPVYMISNKSQKCIPNISMSKSLSSSAQQQQNNNKKTTQLKSTWKHAHFIVTLKKDPEPTNDMFVIHVINIIPVKKICSSMNFRSFVFK